MVPRDRAATKIGVTRRKRECEIGELRRRLGDERQEPETGEQGGQIDERLLAAVLGGDVGQVAASRLVLCASTAERKDRNKNVQHRVLFLFFLFRKEIEVPEYLRQGGSCGAAGHSDDGLGGAGDAQDGRDDRRRGDAGHQGGGVRRAQLQAERAVVEAVGEEAPLFAVCVQLRPVNIIVHHPNERRKKSFLSSLPV